MPLGETPGGPEKRSVGQAERVAQACAALTIAISLLALSGWATGHWIFARLHPDFIPMAPSTALAFLLLGGALFVGTRPSAPSRVRQCACGATALILLMGLLVLAQYLTGTDLDLEAWLSGDSARFGQVPVGRMSPLTAGTFLVASLTLLVLLAVPVVRRLPCEMAASAAAGVAVVGLLVMLGYWRGVAFMHGGGVIPMALPTGAAFVFLGVGLLAAAAPRVLTVRDYRPVIAGFGIGLAASILLFVLVERQGQDLFRIEFERRASTVALAFREDLEDNLSELESIRALYTVSKSVDRAGFRTFASQAMSRCPGMAALSWNPRVSDGQRAAYEAAARADGIAAYQFAERSPDGRLGPARRRAEYVPVFYLEQLEESEAALGFDTASDPMHRVALEKARDTGQAAATAPLTLVQETGKGIFIYMPVYDPGKWTATPAQRRTHLRGFVVEGLRFAPLIRAAFSNLAREGIEYRLVDAAAPPPEDLLSASAGAEAAASTGFRFATEIAVADRRWRAELFPAPWYLAAKSSGQAWLVLGGGLFLTMILGTYLLASARHSAEVLQLTEGLRKISRAVEHSPAVVVITDAQGTIEYVNPKFSQVTGYTAEEAIGQNPRILKSGDTPPEVYQRLWAMIASGQEWRGEFHNKKKSGELFYEAASISPMRRPDGRITHFVAVKEDITERKRADAALATRTSQLEAIRTVSVEITRELELGRLLDLLMQRVRELVATQSALLFLWDEATQRLVPHALAGVGDWVWDLRIRLGEGVTGASAERRTGIIVNDYRTSPYVMPSVVEQARFTGIMSEPLVYREHLVGVLTLWNKVNDVPFDADDQHLLGLFASQAAIAIENARLHERLAHRVERLQALTHVTQLITSSLDPDTVLREVTKSAAEITGAGSATVWMADETQRTVERTASNEEVIDFPKQVFRYGEGSVGWVAEHQSVMNVPDRFADERFCAQDWARRHGFVSFLGVPILMGDSLLAVLALNGERPFLLNSDDQNLLDMFVAQAAVAIKNTRLHEEAVKRGTQLGALLRSTQSVMSGLDLEKTLQIIAREAATISGAPVIRLFLLDEDGQHLRYRTGMGVPREEEAGIVIRVGESFSGQVVTTGQPLMVPDTREDPRLIHRWHVDKYGLVSYLGLPVKREATSIGVLVFNSTAPRVYTEDEMRLLGAFADQAAIAIENARLHAAAVRHGAQMEALLRSFQSVTSGLDLRQILDRIMDEAVRISGAPHVKVLLLDRTTNTLRPGALKGSAMPATASFPLGTSLSGRVAQEGTPLFLEDAQNDPRNVWAERDRELGIVTYLGLPIKLGDEVLGVLTFNTTVPYRYSSEEMNLFTSLAAQAAIAIENARLYEEVQDHAATLEAHVQERTRDLEAARRAAEAASRAKSEFLANMSHELRTPLNATLGFSRLLLERNAGSLTGKQIRYCENIAAAGRRLNDTVTDILTYVELESGQVALERAPLAVEAVVDEALAQARAEVAAKRLRLVPAVASDLPPLRADPARIQQVLRELLRNAVKFTPEGGTITVAARAVAAGEPGSRADGDAAPQPPGSPAPRQFLEIAVSDTGIGIRAEDLPRLFQEFTQLESAYTKRHAGTGIGLAVAKKLVELHEGTIAAASEGEGQGSTFTVRLPLGNTAKHEA